MGTGLHREARQERPFDTVPGCRVSGGKDVDFLDCRPNNFLLFNLIQTTTTGRRVVVSLSRRRIGETTRDT